MDLKEIEKELTENHYIKDNYITTQKGNCANWCKAITKAGKKFDLLIRFYEDTLELDRLNTLVSFNDCMFSVFELMELQDTIRDFDDLVQNLFLNIADAGSLILYKHPKSNMSLIQHYNSIVDEMIEFYNKNLNSDYNLYISSSILPILAFSDKFIVAEAYEFNGTYLAGYLNCGDAVPVSVYVSPILQDEVIANSKNVSEDKYTAFLNVKVI